MMPQPMEHRLIHVLLPWIMILTISQVAFITFYFTAGYHRSFQSRDSGAPEPTVPTTDIISTSPKKSLNTVFSFHANSDNPVTEKIKWQEKKEDQATAKENLTIQQDGYYFLCLQVTVDKNSESVYKVSLKTKTKTLLEGMINPNSSTSTGFMGKVEELSAGDTLVVTISPRTNISTYSHQTHMGLIYLSKY